MSPRSRDHIAGDNKRNSGPVVCSFCNKPDVDVQKMIAGPNGVFICNECVGVCNDILDDGEPHRQTQPDVVEDIGKPEMRSCKCPGCGRAFGIALGPNSN